MNSWLPSLFIVGLYAAFAAGALLTRAQSAQRPPQAAAPPKPWATLALLAAVAVPSTLQLVFPAVLAALQRDYGRFAQGEWWRLITPLFVQDGGLGGTAFNLVALALVGPVAERLWGARRVFGLFFAGGIVGELAGFAWQPVGAGNSIANCSLAAGVAVACLTRRPPRAALALALLALGADVALVGLRDIHGAAALTGAALALALSRRWRGVDGRLGERSA